MDFAWYLFSPEGRINRARYWLAELIIVCWMLFLAALALGITKGVSDSYPASFGFGIDDIFQIADPATYRSAIGKSGHGDLTAAMLIPKIFYAVGTLLFLWVYAATSIKRLHDRNKSGGWMIPFFVVPGLYHQFEDRLGDSWTAAVLGLIVGILVLRGFVEMLCLKGTGRPNRYGPDPLAPVPASAPAASRWDQQSELEFVPHSAGPSPGPHVKRGHD
jgi:uncharacterized membrane protein YhaH (DUF805 family)